jgi:hypothetical protein
MIWEATIKGKGGYAFVLSTGRVGMNPSFNGCACIAMNGVKVIVCEVCINSAATPYCWLNWVFLDV